MKFIKSDDIQTAIVKITRKDAKRLMSKGGNKRPISRANVSKLVNAQQSGEFVLNGESIIISATGEVLNGQHRLLACIETGISFNTIMVFGVPDSVFDTIDNGKGRGLSDAMTIAGDKDGVNRAASTPLIYGYRETPLHVPIAGRNAISDIAMRHYHDDKLAGVELNTAIRYGSSGTLTGYIPPSFLTFLRFEAEMLHPDKTEAFFEVLKTGRNSEEAPSAHNAREKLHQLKIDSTPLHKTNAVAQAMKASIIIYAWNAHLKGQVFRSIKMWKKEAGSYPVMK